MLTQQKNQSEFDVFVSYCRKDARRDPRIIDIVERIKEKSDLRVWMDRNDMDSSECSFSEEIADVIRRSKRVLLFAGSDTPNSAYMESEINYAQIQGLKIFPVLYSVLPADTDRRFSLVPKRYQKKHIRDFSQLEYESEAYFKEIDSLIRDLQKPVTRGKLSTNFKGIPPSYIPRYEYIVEMENQLFGPITSVATETVGGFYGGAGTGKSVLANAFCRDAEIRSQFPDGILWFDVKETGTLRVVFQQLRQEFKDQIPDCFEEEEIKIIIHRFFLNKKMLVVLDDVWEKSISVLDYFCRIFSASGCKLLVTSRVRSVISTYTSAVFEIKYLSPAEAELMMLRSETNPTVLQTGTEASSDSDFTKPVLDSDAAAIIARCNGHMLSIAIACAMHRNGTPWSKILRDINLHHALISEKLEKLPGYGYDHAYAAIAASVDALQDTNTYYRRLAVLPRESGIKLDAVTVLWSSIDPDITNEKTERIIRRLHDNCLVNYDEESCILYLHDLEHEYLLIDSVNEISGLHREFVEAYKQKTGGNWVAGPDDGYYYQHIVYHMLCNSDSLDIAGELLTNYQWIKKKIKLCGCASILQDYREAEHRRPKNIDNVHLIGRCIFLSAEFLASDYRQLPIHLTGRLLDLDKLIGKEMPFIYTFLNQIYLQETDFWLRPTARCMRPPNTNLLNQWSIIAGASSVSCNKTRFVLSTRGENSIIYLFDFNESESVFTWETNTKINYVTLFKNGVVSADCSGNIAVWKVGNPKPTVRHSFPEQIIYIGQLSGGDYLYASDHGMLFWNNKEYRLSHNAKVTSYLLQNDVLYVGFSDGYFSYIDIANKEETAAVLVYEDYSIDSIAVCDSYIAVGATENIQNSDTPDARIAVSEDFLFGTFKEILRLNTKSGGLYFLQDGALLYSEGIFVYYYNIETEKTEKSVAINEHWVINSCCIDEKILCVDNYGHICLFDTANTFVQTFNAYDSFAMRTMVNKESFGSLKTGIRGVPVKYTDVIRLPEHRETKGISPVDFCLVSTPQGIAYADAVYGPCFFPIGEKQPTIAKNSPAKPTYAISHRGKPVIGFEDGAVLVYNDAFEGSLYCRLPSGISTMCSDGENLFCASGNKVFKITGTGSISELSFPACITHIGTKHGYLFIVFGNNQFACRKTGDLSETEIQTTGTRFAGAAIKDAFPMAGYVICFTGENSVFVEHIGDFQLTFDETTRHNSKDRKMLCFDDKVVYCNNTTEDKFGLFIKKIGSNKTVQLEEIRSAVYLSMVLYGKYLIIGSQKDEISIWDKRKGTLVRRINTDSILRAIDIVQDHIAFVSGSHIFWFKIENAEKI